MKIKNLLLASLLLLANQASAIPISSAGDTFNVDWFVDLDNATTTSDLTATSTWTVSSYTSSTIVLDITIANTTILQTGILDEAAIVSFGFGIDPNATAALSIAGTTFDMVAEPTNQIFPGGFKSIDICLFADGCSGGPVTNGLQAGTSDSLQVTLTALTAFGPSTDLLFFPAKFQTTLGSFEPGGTVPEPSMVGLLAIGLLGVVFTRRRTKV